MEKNDLDKTKPIKILKDLDKSDSSTRESKYRDAVLKDKIKMDEEAAEEALVEKNIKLAEELLKEEKDKKEKVAMLEEQIDEEIEKDSKKKDKVRVFDKLKAKWSTLNKKQKSVVIVLVSILSILLIVLIALLVIKLTDKDNDMAKNNVPKDEVVPVVVDNYYYKDGSLYLLNEEEKEIGTYKCATADDNLCYVAYNAGRDDFDVPKLVDVDGNVKQQRLPIYHDNYVFIFDNKSEKDSTIILYSIKENKEVARYSQVKAFESGEIIVKDVNGKYGLIILDSTNGLLKSLDNKYDYLGMIEGEEKLIAKTKDGYFIIDSTGKELSESINSKVLIKSYNNKYIITQSGKEYSAYNYDGKLVVSGYDFISTYDKYLLLVDGNRLYVTDEEKNKYTEDGIKLNNKDYVKTYVYQEDELVETKRSFEVSLNDYELEITLWKDENEDTSCKKISLAEVNVNKNYEYVNYLDGKLYFYKDKEKEDLLGFYSCANPNVVDMKSTKYASCFVATDSLFADNDMIPTGYLTRNSAIPIINDRYVFVADGNNNIVLVDVVNRENKSSYMKVESNTEHNEGKITKKSGNIDVIVQNKKGKYGVITIGKENVSVKHTFDYSKLELLGNYFLGYDSGNNWRVLFDDVETMGFSNKIRGYNYTKRYFKVIENGKYYVYNESAMKVSEEAYAYVELYGDFYAALDNDKNIYIYNYLGEKLVNVTTQVGNYQLYGTDTPAFKISKSNDGYVVSIWNGTQYETTILSNTIVEEPPVEEPSMEDPGEDNQS